MASRELTVEETAGWTFFIYKIFFTVLSDDRFQMTTFHLKKKRKKKEFCIVVHSGWRVGLINLNILTHRLQTLERHKGSFLALMDLILLLIKCVPAICAICHDN